MSVLHPKADILTRGIDVGYVTIADIRLSASAYSRESCSQPKRVSVWTASSLLSQPLPWLN